MTSLERREARYQRRKAKRNKQTPTFEDVFSFEHLYNASRRCRLGVGWKASTQRHLSRELMVVTELYKSLHLGKYKALPFSEFDLVERGKQRHIKSCHIKDRAVQKCLCENCLVPILAPKLIYDNGACMKNKGVHFARNRLLCHLQRHYRKYGAGGYVLVFDFKSYFDSIPHQTLIDKLCTYIKDDRLIKVYQGLVSDFGGNKGLGLGSQISQISAVFFLNGFDHFIKEKLRIKGYGRYMDDGYLIHQDKKYLALCLKRMREYCNSLGITLNLKKTQIAKLAAGFNYLKQRWLMLPSGKIIRTPVKANIIRQRRKLKRFSVKLKNGSIKLENVAMSQLSWRSCIEKINAKRQLWNMENLYKKLFGGIV